MDSSFVKFLLRRIPLSEVTEYFPRRIFNDIFRETCNGIFDAEELSPEVRTDLFKIAKIDLVGYVDSSLRRSGFQEFELDEFVSEILVQLLVTPGSLFKKWNRQGILSARLKVAIRNAVITLAKKSKTKKRRLQELPNNLPDSEVQCVNDPHLIQQFRDELHRRIGEPAVRVFDCRLADDDIKTLIGSEGIGTSYRLKQLVSRIKEVATTFGDECFQAMVARMQVREAETLRKRFGKTRKVH